MTTRITRLIILAAVFCGSLLLGSQWVAHADTEPTPRPVMLPTVTPAATPTSAPVPAQPPAQPPAQSPAAPVATPTPEPPTPEPTAQPKAAQPVRPIKPNPTPGFEIDNSPVVVPTSSLPLPSIDDAADEVASQIEIRYKQASSTVNTVAKTIDYTNVLLLLGLTIVVGIIIGLLVLTLGRLIAMKRRTGNAARVASAWQGQTQAHHGQAFAATDQRVDPDSDAVILCKLVSDTIGRIVFPSSHDLAQVDDEPVPHMVVLATDGHAYILTSDVFALRRGNLVGGNARTWHIANPRSFAFTRAQAIWDRAVNLYCVRPKAAKPVSNWHIVMMAAAPWQTGQSSSSPQPAM